MALFLPDQNLLILHIPRTGGTWIKSALSAWGVRWEHAHGPGEHNLPGAYEHPGAARAAFIRHPIPWLESMWRGLHQGWPVDRPGSALVRERHWSANRLLGRLAGEREFPLFIKRLLEEQPGFVSRMVEWYVGPPGAPLVNFVGRQEHLDLHLRALLYRYGWSGEPTDVPRANIAEHPAPDWNDSFKERVLAAEQPLLRRFYSDPSAVLPHVSGEVW
jgi:hypothetical protein